MKNISKYLNIDNLHDNNILGLSSIEDNHLILKVANLEKKIMNILFKNIKNIKIDNYRLGNIILSIDIYEKADKNNIDDFLCFIYDISFDELNQDYIKEIRRLIEIGECLIVYIQCSYGLKGVILCKEIALL